MHFPECMATTKGLLQAENERTLKKPYKEINILIKKNWWTIIKANIIITIIRYNKLLSFKYDLRD